MLSRFLTVHVNVELLQVAYIFSLASIPQRCTSIIIVLSRNLLESLHCLLPHVLQIHFHIQSKRLSYAMTVDF